MNLDVGVVEFNLCLVVVLTGLIMVRSNDVDVEEESRGKLTVRLVGSIDGLSGRLEVFEHRAWGTVCNTTFDHRAASVVCRQLGFTGGLDVHNVTMFGRGGEGITLSESSCVGSEPSLSDCQLKLMREETHLQRRSLRPCLNHLQDVGVVCQNDTDVVKGVRLSGGRNDVSGRLDVYTRGKWGTVCERGFTYSAARVACTQLGLHSVARPILFGPEVPQDRDLNVALSDLRCSGSERFLQDCPSFDPIRSFCSKDRAVGLICENDPETIFFLAMSPHSVVHPDDVGRQSYLVNGEDIFHFEMSGGSGQVLLRAMVNVSDIFLRVILRKYRNSTTILGRRWTTVEHSVWFCQANESTCRKISSKLESVLGYRDWTNYTVSAATGGTVLRIESGQPGPVAPTLLSVPLLVSLGNSFYVTLGAGQESEVIYRVRRSQDVNRCYLREEEDDASRLRRCGDAFVDSSLCRRCGCCYDPSVRPHCYIPVVASVVINEGPCLRSLSEILGQVVVMTEKVVCVGEMTTLAIGVQTYHNSVNLSVDMGNGNVTKHLQLLRATALSGWITSRYEELADSLPYWTFIDVVYGRAGRYSVTVSFDADRMETYVTPANVAIVEKRNSRGYLYDDGPTYYLHDDIDLFFLIENYGAELSFRFEVQDPSGTITQSLLLDTMSSASVPTWASMKLSSNVTDRLTEFKSTAFQIYAVSIGKYVIKAVANSTCHVETVQTNIEVSPRPRLREVIGDLRFIVDDSYYPKVVTNVVLIVSRLSRAPKLEVNYGEGFREVAFPVYRSRLPDFAVVKLSLLPQGSVSWIVLKHTFPMCGNYNVEVIYSDAKWVFSVDRLRLSVSIPVICKYRFTFEGGGSAKENATVYGRGQVVRLVASLACDCSSEPAVVEWSVQQVIDGSTSEERVDVVIPLMRTSGLVLLVPSFTLEYGFYVFSCRVSIRGYSNNLSHDIWVRVEPGPLQAQILQGITQVVEWLSNVTIDASRSSDPDVEGQMSFDNLSFLWFCRTNSKKLSDPVLEEDSCFVDSSVNQTLTGPTLRFNTTQLRVVHFPSMYTFYLLVNKSDSRQANTRHVLMVAAKVVSRTPPASTTAATPSEEDFQYHLDVEPVIDLRCMRNCLESEYANGELELVAVCRNCVPGEVLSYAWSLVTLEGENLTDVDWDVVSTTGATRSNLILLTSGIESAVDRLFVTVSVRRELGESGSASFAIKVIPMTSLRTAAAKSGALSLRSYDCHVHKVPIAICSALLFSLEILFLAGFLSRTNLDVYW